MSQPSPINPLWYAVWTRSHCEQLVTDQLLARGFETFLPKVNAWMRVGKTRRRAEQPLFPGYLFIRHALDKASHVEILKARGVVRLLGDRWDRLSHVPEEEVHAVRRMVESGEPVFRHRQLHEGDRVRITNGPLQGLEGWFVKARPTKGLFLVSVSLLHRSVAVEVDATIVEAS